MSDRDSRIEDLTRQIRALDEQRAPLADERSRLRTQAARERWPDGPFTLHWWRHHAAQSAEYDEPLDAVGYARHIDDSGGGSPERITDRHGSEIYDLRSYPPKRVAAGYPEPPDHL